MKNNCEEMMTADPIFCFANDKVHRAAQMKDLDIRAVPTCDKATNKKFLAGIVAQADLGIRLGAPDELAEVLTKVSRPAFWVSKREDL